jgi:hypothetical protein
LSSYLHNISKTKVAADNNGIGPVRHRCEAELGFALGVEDGLEPAPDAPGLCKIRGKQASTGN